MSASSSRDNRVTTRPARGRSVSPDGGLVKRGEGQVIIRPVAKGGYDFTGPVRVIGPNQAVTMDFNPERINLETDAVGIITRVFCG